MKAGDAGLLIERRGFTKNGQPVEITRSWYRGDAYDFVAELAQGRAVRLDLGAHGGRGLGGLGEHAGGLFGLEGGGAHHDPALSSATKS
jgi:hypothetical protein